ncbi:phosphoribosylformylglycinamidine synthase I [Candidatus Peregrinibacteria bacterium]|nr:phosphoribosylformylglycinamidine synthase I [Candidatus Peregrinibacteria bacterium]
MSHKIGVILFPGTNCELEAIRALKRSGFDVTLIRWNDQKIDYTLFDGFFMPGGFAYEDRGRSGIIASKDPLVKKIKTEAEKGKLIIGVCNGAQVVLEAKMIPGLDKNHVEMALAWNERVDKTGKILGNGFYNDWIYIKSTAKKGRCAFNCFEDDHIMRIPVAHGEGRYTTLDTGLLDVLQNNDQLVFSYCSKNGEVVNEFPINPNGAVLNIAGICNPQGNVLALMPHPERTVNGQAIFDSMKAYLDKSFHITLPQLVTARESKLIDEIKNYEQPDIEILVDLVITDNEERTIEHAVQDIGYKNVKLKKQTCYKIDAEDNVDFKELSKKLIDSGELVNLAKEIPTIIIRDGFKKIETTIKENGIDYLTFDKENIVGDTLLQTLNSHFNINGIKSIKVGKKWTIYADKTISEEIVKTQIFHNPHAMDIFKV